MLILLSFADNGNLRKIIQDYQGLIGGVFALIGAYAAWYSLEKQNHIRSKELEAVRLQEAIVARASLTFLLDELFTYTSNCSAYLKARFDSAGDLRVFTNLIGPDGQNYLPVLPNGIITGLFDVVKATTGSPQVVLTNLLLKLQINNARLVAFDKLILTSGWAGTRQYEYIDRILDVSEIRTLAANLFPFARLEIENVRKVISASEVKEHYDQLGFDGWESDPKLQKYFEIGLSKRDGNLTPAA